MTLPSLKKWRWFVLNHFCSIIKAKDDLVVRLKNLFCGASKFSFYVSFLFCYLLLENYFAFTVTSIYDGKIYANLQFPNKTRHVDCLNIDISILYYNPCIL